MRILVIGFGSIGRRHAQLLAEAGRHEVSILSSQVVKEYKGYNSLKTALQECRPEFCLIASTTCRHGQDLAALSAQGYTGPVLVEKPLSHQLEEVSDFYPLFPVMVGYNLRFHPVIRALKKKLEGQTILAAHIIAGQHLSQWRPERDVMETYSAWKDQGGGVVRDLSHELDLAQYILGPLAYIASRVLRAGEVTGNSEDLAAILLSSPACPLITIHLNYLDHQPRRHWLVLTERQTIEADLRRGTLTVNGVVESFPLIPNETYILMHEAALEGGSEICSWEEGVSIVELINRIAPL